MFLTSLILLFFYTANFSNAAHASTCATVIPDGYLDKGFSIVYYEVPFKSDKSEIPNYLYNTTIDFAENGIPTYRNIYDLSFNFTVPDSDSPTTGYPYPGFIAALSNFGVAYYGVFVPQETGEHTFTFDEVDDGASFYIWDNRDMYCCEDMDRVAWLPKISQLVYIPSNPEYQSNSITVNLEKGKDYVFQYTYTNFGGDAVFKNSVTLPSGETISNFKGYVYTTYSGFSCKILNETSSVFSLGTESYTTTYSTTEVTNVYTASQLGIPYTDIQTIYYIMTPTSTSSSSYATSSSAISSSTITSSAISSSFISSSVISSSVISSFTVSSSVISGLATSGISDVMTSSSISQSLVSSKSSSSRFLSTGKPDEGTSVILSSATYDASSSSTDSSSSTKLIISTSDSIHISTSATGGKSSSKDDTVRSTDSQQISSHSNSNGFLNAASFGKSTVTGTDITSEITNSFSGISLSNSYNTDSTNTISTPSTTLSQKLDDDKPHGNSVSISTYTDQYGLTKTVLVDCSTDLKTNSNHATLSNNESIVTVINNQGHGTTSTVKNGEHTTVLGTTATDSPMHNYGTRSTAVSAVSVQSQKVSEVSSSSSKIQIQESPNNARKNIGGALLSLCTLFFSILL